MTNLFKNFNPKLNKRLFEYQDYFNFLKDLLDNDKLPKVIMLSGNKGEGKFSLISHLMNYYFDKTNYDNQRNMILNNSTFYLQYLKDTFPNIIHLNASFFQNIKIEDVRLLKNNLSKKPINNKKRFIILDDIELFNLNSLNALLKTLEEPGKSDYFILINNRSKNLIETIKSRCLEIRVIINENKRKKIISQLEALFNISSRIEKELVKISPGNFLKFNHIIMRENLDIEKNLLINFKSILNLFKKEKDIFYKDLLLFVTEYYLQKKKIYNYKDYKFMIEERSFILKNIHNFFTHNLNQNTFLNSLKTKYNG